VIAQHKIDFKEFSSNDETLEDESQSVINDEELEALNFNSLVNNLQ